MILTAGLSPAWQQILAFDGLVAGAVNRAQTAHWCASGKVLNTGRAVASLGGTGQVVCPRGGLTGQALQADIEAAGIDVSWIDTRTSTRVCTTLIDQSTDPPTVTELVENATAISDADLLAFEMMYVSKLQQASVVILTGSLPDVVGQGPPTGLWQRMLSHHIPTILDVRGAELMAALPGRPRLVKPNRDELAATLGRTLADESAVIAGMQELRTSGAEWVLITAGPQPSLLTDGHIVWRFTPPGIRLVNPIGCGDCLTAGIAVALADGVEMPEAVRFGMAASVENACQLLPAHLSLEAVRRRVDDIRIARQSW